MRAFPADFIASLQPPGAQTYWVLQLTTAASGVFYVSDNDRTIAPWGVTAYGLAKSFGEIASGITNPLDGFPVAEYSVTLLCGLPLASTTAVSATLDALADSGALDGISADLYLGIDGIASPPQLICPGFVRDFGEISDTSFSLTIQDTTVKLENAYVGELITAANYPQAAPSDVGTVIPIAFGTVGKAPARALAGCLQTVLTVACTAGDTSIYVATTTAISVGMIFYLEAEQIGVSAVGSYTITVVRGYNSTTAAAHAKGCSLVQATTQVYVPSWRALTSIQKVWLRLSEEVDLDITAYCTLYTGQGGSQLTGYGAMAAIALTAAGMQSVLDIIQLRQSDTIGVTTGNHGHTAEGSRTQAASNTGVQYGGSGYSNITAYPTYPAVSGEVEETNTYDVAYGGDGSSKTLYINGQQQQTGFASNTSFKWVGTTVGIPSVYVTGGNVWVKFNAAQRSITYNVPTTDSPATGVAKTGAAQMTGSAMTSYFGSGKIFVDLTADTGSPTGIGSWILAQRGLSAVRTVGILTATSFNGVINYYKTALYWLNYLAFQSGAFFMFATGIARFISRTPGQPVKTITACVASEDGRRSLTRGRTNLTQVVDKISVKYRRDWSQSSGPDAYAATTPAAGSGSHERPELFQCDFIVDDASALALQSCYLASNGARRKLRTMDCWIDRADIEPGDTVHLGFVDNEIGIAIAAGPAPGSCERADLIKLTVIV